MLYNNLNKTHIIEPIQPIEVVLAYFLINKQTGFKILLNCCIQFLDIIVPQVDIDIDRMLFCSCPPSSVVLQIWRKTSHMEALIIIVCIFEKLSV